MRHPRLSVSLLAILFTSVSGCSDNGHEASRETRQELSRGFEALINGLREAQQAIERPWSEGDGPSERELAEGYRYAIGHLLRTAEADLQQDPNLPYFQRYVRMASKGTIDNPDTMLLVAKIDPGGEYRIRGRLPNFHDWRSGERDRSYPKAPRVVTMQTITALVGENGHLDAFATCRNQSLGFLQNLDLKPSLDGRFEVAVAKARPAGHEGAFLPTHARIPCVPPGGEAFEQDQQARFVAVREVFSDWDREVPIELDIVRTDIEGYRRPAPAAPAIAETLAAIGEKVANQVRFWNAYHEFRLEVHGDRDGDGRANVPRNDLNPAAPPLRTSEIARMRQLDSLGTFDLGEKDALVIRVETPSEPYYAGFQLANFWGESLDQASYTSSLTGGQLKATQDGVRTYIVSHEDPGVAGWLDTTGLAKGQMILRFIYAEDPSEADRPRISAELMGIESVAAHLPRSTPSVTPDARREQIRRRQTHIRKRWRQY